MEIFIELLKEVNIVQIFILLSAGWMAYSRLDKKIEKIENRMTILEHEMHKLKYDMVEVKTILRMKECCMINDERQTKKVE